MWKPIAVVGLWAFLVGLPHVVAPGQISLAGVAIGMPAVDRGDELGDPPITEQAPPAARPVPPGSFATIHFKNELSKSLSIVEARVSMDGKPLSPVDEPRSGSDVVVFGGRVSPGEHVVRTEVACRRNQRGPFTYLKAYKLNVASEDVLTVPRERAVVFTVAATPNKGINVPFDKQVGIAVWAEELPEPGAHD